MPLVLITLIFIFLTNTVFLPNFFASLSERAQMICQSHAPWSPYAAWYSGIVCGTSVRGEPFYDEVVHSGLIHLLVVSGSHLVFLETLIIYLSKLARRGKPLPSIFIDLLLLGYVVLTGWQTPALRSLIFILLKKINQRCKLFWTPVWLTAFSIPLAAAMSDARGYSLSLALSWVAALALHTRLSHETFFRRMILVFIFTWPILAMLTPPTLQTILFNTLLAPILGFLLFPISALPFFYRPLTTLTDNLWWVFFWLMDHLSSPIRNPHPALSFSLPYAFLYAVLLQIICLRRKFSRGDM